MNGDSTERRFLGDGLSRRSSLGGVMSENVSSSRVLCAFFGSVVDGGSLTPAGDEGGLEERSIQSVELIGFANRSRGFVVESVRCEAGED